MLILSAAENRLSVGNLVPVIKVCSATAVQIKIKVGGFQNGIEKIKG